MNSSNNKDKEKVNKKAKATMMFSLGEKRMARFKELADKAEKNYSAILQELIDDWMEKQSKKKP